uniref:Integrase core domain containing protein n=1 Tax=Solanum tuberosum TaxID=4113 RepID=M1DJY3_SOLTU
MKDDISAHKHLPGEAMHDTWWRFNQKLKKCPNHGLIERHLKQDFFRSLNYVTKHVANVVCGGSFMTKPFTESMQLMDEVSKNNRAWYTRDAEVGYLGFTFELSAEQRKREEERDQDMSHMRTQIDLLTKHIVASSEKVNAVGPPNMYKDQDIDLDEEAKYLGNQRGFQNYNSGNQGYNSGNAGRNYSREG